MIRAYCRHCYSAAADGDYRAGGAGLHMDYALFATRFGAPGPSPPPATPVDRLLARLIRDPALRALTPANEAAARRRRQIPYPVRAAFVIGDAPAEARMLVTVSGQVLDLEGDPGACAHVRETLAGV